MNVLLIFAYGLFLSAASVTAAAFQLIPAKTLRPPFHSRFNYFDTDLLRYMAEKSKGNFMISPASVKSTLVMLLEGAHGECADELRQALRLPEDLNEMREEIRGYLDSLRIKTAGVTLENANAIFMSQRFNAVKSYVDILRETYHAEMLSVPFDDVALTAKIVNTWVGNHTNGLIPSIIDPYDIEPQTLAMLANAMYFKAIWENSFDVNLTSIRNFCNSDSCKKVYMMENTGEFNYGHIDGLKSQAIELPYQGRTHSMVILLPDERDGVSSMIRDLPYVSLSQILQEMEPTEVEVSMPKFTVEFGEDLVDVLRSAGIQKIFTNQANLSGIVDSIEQPHINNIYHKTFIDVDEIGSVAAAATGAMVIPLIGTLSVRLDINKPFLFFIRDVKTGAVLFEGRIDKPLEAPQTLSDETYPNTPMLDDEFNKYIQRLQNMRTTPGVQKSITQQKENDSPRRATEALKDAASLGYRTMEAIPLRKKTNTLRGMEVNFANGERLPLTNNYNALSADAPNRRVHIKRLRKINKPSQHFYNNRLTNKNHAYSKSLQPHSTSSYHAHKSSLSKFNSNSIIMDLEQFLSDHLLNINHLTINNNDDLQHGDQMRMQPVSRPITYQQAKHPQGISFVLDS